MCGQLRLSDRGAELPAPCDVNLIACDYSTLYVLPHLLSPKWSSIWKTSNACTPELFHAFDHPRLHQVIAALVLWRLFIGIRTHLVCHKGSILPHHCAARLTLWNRVWTSRRQVSLDTDRPDRHSLLWILPGTWKDASENDGAKEVLLWVRVNC